MKINILIITPLALTALLVTGSPVDTISDKDPVSHLLFFSRFLSGNLERDINSDKTAREILRDQEWVNAMLGVANDVENFVFDPDDQKKTTTFLASDIGREFKNDLEEIIKDGEKISDREAKISLLLHVKLYSNPSVIYRIGEIEKRLHSREMAKEMLNVIKDVEKNALEEPYEDMITKFLDGKEGTHLFSKDDILAAICFLKRATNPSVKTQA
ncbi:hypothetical protein IWQ61_008639 [Dispira simplex]|nr:hypothetical protein IWQ61_008639 [Dispira simplex]